jgi:WD40 repeat protein
MGVYSNVVVVCAKTGTTQYTLKGHKNNISCLCYSPDGRFLASSSWDGTIKLWDLSKQKCVRTFLEASEYGKFSRGLLAYSPCGNYIAGIHNNTWKIWELI